jgi:tartrate dehydratase beta subunit/fumarate hydratase class I family protein
MKTFTFPFSEEKIRALKVGGEALISGVVFTGRDAAARPPGEKVHRISSIA